MAHRRLFNVSQHLGRGAHSKATAGLITMATGEEGSETVVQGPKLFDDQQMMDFIREGYVMFRLDDLPRLYHDGIVDKLNRVIEKHGNPGNNMLPMVPELMTMLKHPVVDGALQSILGEPAMHTCCSTPRTKLTFWSACPCRNRLLHSLTPACSQPVELKRRRGHAGRCQAPAQGQPRELEVLRGQQATAAPCANVHANVYVCPHHAFGTGRAQFDSQ